MTINPLNWLRSLVRGELRATLAEPDPFLQAFFNGGYGANKSGVLVNEQTAATFSAVWQARQVISEAVASLPYLVYSRMTPRGRQREDGHPAFRLLDEQPNDEMDAFVFRETLMGHVLLWGNGIAEIERTNGGVPVALWPIRPDRWQPIRDPADQRIKYQIWTPNQPDVILDPEDVFHVKGLGFDGLVGYSIIRFARQSVGLGLGAETFGAAFFGNGSTAKGFLSFPGKLSDPAQKRLRESWEATHGGPENANKTALLEEGMKWTQTTIPPDDAQFLQTRQFQVAEVARWFNLAPHKLNDLSHATNNNIEQQSIDFVQHSIRPWLLRWEHEARRKLFRKSEQATMYGEHLVDGLLRGDTVTRYNAYAKGIQYGWFSANDVRDRENLNPLPGGQGDIYLVPVNMQPGAVVEKQAEAAEAGDVPEPGQPSDPAAEPDDESLTESKRAAIFEAHRPLLLDAAVRVVRREAEVLRRALKKPQTFAAFAETFYHEHEKYVRSAIDPVTTSLAGSLAAATGVNTIIAASLPCDYVKQDRAELLLATQNASAPDMCVAVEAILTRWETEKPAAIAEQVRQEVMNHEAH